MRTGPLAYRYVLRLAAQVAERHRVGADAASGRSPPPATVQPRASRSRWRGYERQAGRSGRGGRTDPAGGWAPADYEPRCPAPPAPPLNSHVEGSVEVPAHAPLADACTRRGGGASAGVSSVGHPRRRYRRYRPPPPSAPHRRQRRPADHLQATRPRVRCLHARSLRPPRRAGRRFCCTSSRRPAPP